MLTCIMLFPAAMLLLTAGSHGQMYIVETESNEHYLVNLDQAAAEEPGLSGVSSRFLAPIGSSSSQDYIEEVSDEDIVIEDDIREGDVIEDTVKEEGIIEDDGNGDGIIDDDKIVKGVIEDDRNEEGVREDYGNEEGAIEDEEEEDGVVENNGKEEGKIEDEGKEDGVVEDDVNEEGTIEDDVNEEGIIEDVGNKDSVIEDDGNEDGEIEDNRNEEGVIEDVGNKDSVIEDDGKEDGANECSASGKPCVFPFKWIRTNKTYTTCTLDFGSEFWCSTQVDDEGYHVSGNWGECDASCPVDDSKLVKTCKTEENQDCIFPVIDGFSYQGCLPETGFDHGYCLTEGSVEKARCGKSCKKDELITEDDLTISQIVKTLSERKTVYTKIAWEKNATCTSLLEKKFQESKKLHKTADSWTKLLTEVCLNNCDGMDATQKRICLSSQTTKRFQANKEGSAEKEGRATKADCQIMCGIPRRK